MEDFELELNNFDLFFKKSDLEWLQSLNSDQSMGSEFKLVLRDTNRSYEYPDEDFCLFKNFPHEKLVFPIIHSRESLNCSCTLLWLLKNSANYSDQVEIMTLSVRNCTSNETSSWEDLMSNCEFENRVSECDYKPTTIEMVTMVERETTASKPTKRPTTERFTLGFLTKLPRKTRIDSTTSIIFGCIGIVSLMLVGFLAYTFYSKRRTTFSRRKKVTEDHELINRL